VKIKHGDRGFGVDSVEVKTVVGETRRKIVERRLTMAEKQMVHMYDPSVDAFREVPLEKCIKTIREAKKMEKDLLAKGIITEEVKAE
jgi:phosphoglycolate phosphatase-like HAD superfamily hydrolase